MEKNKNKKECRNCVVTVELNVKKIYKGLAKFIGANWPSFFTYFFFYVLGRGGGEYLCPKAGGIHSSLSPLGTQSYFRNNYIILH